MKNKIISDFTFLSFLCIVCSLAERIHTAVKRFVTVHVVQAADINHMIISLHIVFRAEPADDAGTGSFIAFLINDTPVKFTFH